MVDWQKKPWPSRFPQHYERSFDGGATWALCSRLDIRNSFLAIKEVLAELDKGKLVISAHGVQYRRLKDVKPSPARTKETASRSKGE